MDLAAVFAGLDRIARSEPHHAHGPAEDVPDLLRALTASAEEVAAEAEQELWGSLLHQGTVYAPPRSPPPDANAYGCSRTGSVASSARAATPRSSAATRSSVPPPEPCRRA